MAKKQAKTSNKKPTRTTSTPVRRSPIPKSVAVKPASVTTSRPVAQTARKNITWQDIQLRAYYIFRNGAPGCQDDHWFQAERELRVGI